jgi:hypothetical protein
MIGNKITTKKIIKNAMQKIINKKKEKNTAPTPFIWVSNQSLPSFLLKNLIPLCKDVPPSYVVNLLASKDFLGMPIPIFAPFCV